MPDGYTANESWSCLKKCWKGFQASRRERNQHKLRKFARKIHSLGKNLGLITYSFQDFDFEFQLLTCSYKKNTVTYMDENVTTKSDGFNPSADMVTKDAQNCYYKLKEKNTYLQNQRQQGPCWYNKESQARSQYYQDRKNNHVYKHRKSCVYKNQW